MAKAATAESPADRVKRELAEREQREKEAAEASQEQPTADTLTDAEKALLKKWIDEGANFGAWTKKAAK